MRANKILQERFEITEEGFKETGGREWIYKNLAHKMAEAMSPDELKKLFCITETGGATRETREKLRDPATPEVERRKLEHLAKYRLIEYKAEIEFHPWAAMSPPKRYVI